MKEPMQGRIPDANRLRDLATRQRAEDEVQEASEESFPASDSSSWTTGHEAALAPSSPAETDKPKQGCAFSFLTEERGEMDKLCERTPAEQHEEYTQPDKEKEAGGEA
jgi:hypothetical protein